MNRNRYILFIFLIGSVCCAQSPSDSTYFVPQFNYDIHYTVKTSYGEIYRGYLKEETKEFVVFENRITHKTVELRKSAIVHVSNAKVRDFDDEVLGENLHAKNYLTTSSAFLFNEGKLSANSHWLLLENIDYALNENWAITLNTIAFYPVSLGVKCNYQLTGYNYIGATVFGIANITSGNTGNLLFGYGAEGKYTKGSTNKNFTFSGGLLGLSSKLFYTGTKNPFVNVGFVSLAYCNRFSKKVALNLEGWYLPDVSVGLAGVGFKFVSNPYSSWTVGCFVFMNGQDHSVQLSLRTLPIPYFGVARRFN